MNINRNNYEEYFLLYADNELPAAEKEAVDVFVAEHPDLKEELEMLLLSVLPAGDTVFSDKELLYRTTDTGSLVNMTNFESFFVRYCDDELTNEEKAATELFVYRHPEFQVDFELIQQARLRPDTTLSFPGRESLYRHEKNKQRPLVIRWLSVAAAAMLLLLSGLFWLNTRKEQAQPVNAGIARTAAPAPSSPNGNAVTLPANTGNNEQQPKNENNSNPATERGTNGNAQPVLARTVQPAQQPANQPARPATETETPVASLPAAGGVALPTLVANDASRPAVTENAAGSLALTVPKAALADQASNTPEYVYVNTDDSPSREDYIYVSGAEENRKTPLRGFFRKAGRVLEQNNPLGTEKKRSGVFTASAEQ